MNPSYPTTFAEIGEWARRNQIGVAEARVRFAQYAVLDAIAGSRELRQACVLKGGNALDFFWQPNRSTTDLDFSFDQISDAPVLDAERLRVLLQRSLAATGRELGIAFNVQSVKPRTPRPGRTFVTYEIGVGYALPDDVRMRRMIADRVPVSQILRLDISINEEICETEQMILSASGSIRVSTLEDIVAEKLRSLLQQTVRNRYRCQDALDIAVRIDSHEEGRIDQKKVAEYLQRKSQARGVNVSRAAFQNPDVWARARSDYDLLEVTTRETFIPFDAAMSSVLDFVSTLDIPKS